MGLESLDNRISRLEQRLGGSEALGRLVPLRLGARCRRFRAAGVSECHAHIDLDLVSGQSTP